MNNNLQELPIDQNDYSGTYEAHPLEVSLFRADSGAAAVNMELRLIGRYNPETKLFDSWAEHAFGVTGAFWIIKKDGSANKDGIQSVAKALGWNGDPGKLQGTHWAPVTVQVKVEKDTYKDKTTYRAIFINPQGTPVVGGKLSASALSDFTSQFGGMLSAYAAEAGVTAEAPTTTAIQQPVNLDPPKADTVNF